MQSKPDAAAAHQVLGLVSLERGRVREAIDHLQRALALRGQLVPAHNGLGRAYALLGDLDQALVHLDTAVFLQPDHAVAHFNRSLLWLKQGRYQEGWIEYEWRWACKQVARPDIPRPRWDGGPLGNRAILVFTEQGVGDVLQFVRFLPLLKRRCGRVIMACRQPLQRLLASQPAVDGWFPINEPGKIDFDLYTPLLSLPWLLRIDEDTIPREVPYIFADPERVERWRRPIQELPGFKVGLCWQGSPTFTDDRLRSIPLSCYAPLATVGGVTLVSLQKGSGTEQIEPNRERVPLHVLDGLDHDAPFLDTAAVMQHLDLVITSDTGIAHLAGALGRPVWVVLPVGCDWRWQIGRTDSPWYPTMRLFRQKAFADWSGVFLEVAAALQAERTGRVRVMLERTAEQGYWIPISPGELLDKITILEIKFTRLGSEEQRVNVQRELELLDAVRRQRIPASPALEQLAVSLRRVNEQLWEVEDDLRLAEQAQCFDSAFIELARSVYRINDERSVLKRRVNELLQSALVEEKSYGAKDWNGSRFGADLEGTNHLR